MWSHRIQTSSLLQHLVYYTCSACSQFLLEGRKSTGSLPWSLVTYLQLKKCKYISNGVIIKSLLPNISRTNRTFCYLFLYPFQNNQNLKIFRLQRPQYLCRIQNQVCNCCCSFLNDICTVLTFQSVLHQYKDFLVGYLQA